MDFDINKYLPSQAQMDEDEDFKRRVIVGSDVLKALQTPSFGEVYLGKNMPRPDIDASAKMATDAVPKQDPSKYVDLLKTYEDTVKKKAENERRGILAPQPWIKGLRDSGIDVADNVTIGELEDSKYPNLQQILDAKSKGIKRDTTRKEKNEREDLAFVEGIRKERGGNPITKATGDIVQSYGKILKAAEKPSAAGDVSLIYAYMKMLDPGSTVREGEFATAQNAGSVPERIAATYNKALKGERLSDEIRRDFVGQARNIYDSQKVVQDRVDSQYKNLVQKRGLNPQDAIINVWEEPATSTPQTAGPKPGDVEDGHLFKGGDPADPKNWVPMEKR